jgi:DNA-binding NarL/FixJ family response regulator
VPDLAMSGQATTGWGLGTGIEPGTGLAVSASSRDGASSCPSAPAPMAVPSALKRGTSRSSHRGIHQFRAPLAIVIVTTFDLDEYVHGALKAGARGFLLKDAGPELLVQAIRAAANGDALIAPSVTARLLATFSNPRAGRPPAQPIEPLTDREEQVLVTVARGRTNAEIADELHISLSTVKAHLASMMTKLSARNRVELAMWAYETNRITDD